MRNSRVYIITLHCSDCLIQLVKKSQIMLPYLTPTSHLLNGMRVAHPIYSTFIIMISNLRRLVAINYNHLHGITGHFISVERRIYICKCIMRTNWLSVAVEDTSTYMGMAVIKLIM